MAFIKFRNGFDISTTAAIDKRIYLTKAEMLTAEDDFNLPDAYFAICPDDGKLYMYNKNNETSETTGKFKLIDDVIDFKIPESETAKEDFDKAISESNTVIENTKAIEEVKKQLDSLQLDGGEVQASYNLIGSLSNVTADASNASQVDYSGSASLTFVAATDYTLPDTILVNNVALTAGTSTYTNCNGCNARWSYITPGLLELETVVNIVYYTISAVKE